MTTAGVYYPQDFVEEFSPLAPGTGWGEQFDSVLWELEQHGFVAAVGVHEGYLDDLANMSGQEHIVDFCSSDPDRFGDKEKVRDWLQKGRAMIGIYAVRGWKRGDKVIFSDSARFNSDNLEQVAYGWFGPEQDEEGEPTEEITTAYRVGEAGRQLSRERRLDGTDKFKLGLPLGRLVLAAATDIYGIEAGDITLETWESNDANKLYDILEFVETGSKEDERPTTKPIGTVINGNAVYFNKEKKRNMVKDKRLFKRLDRSFLTTAT